MKRFGIALAALLVLAISAGAQVRFENAEFLSKLGLSESEVKKVQEIQFNADRQKQAAQVELNVYKAQLEKILLDPKADMKEVERLLRESMEWRVKGDLAEIRARVEIRALVGEEKWAKIVRGLQQLRERREQAQKKGS